MTSGQFTVSLTVTTANGCVDSVHRTVTVYVMPDANFIASSVCQDSVMMFNNTSSVSNGTLSYDWDFAGQGTSTDEDPSFTFNGFGNFDVELIATTSNGCADTMVKTVVVHPTPTADFIANDACLNEKSVFEDRSTVPTGAITEYFWNFGDSTSSDIEDPTHTYDQFGNYQITLMATNAFGCKDSLTSEWVKVELPARVFIPSAFTPDGDGINDVFQVVSNYHTKFSGAIFNRWGNEIFRFNDASDSWNGKNGAIPMIPGVYVYRFNIDDKEYVGQVTLIR